MTTSTDRRQSRLPTPLGLTAVAVLVASFALDVTVPALVGTQDFQWWTLDGRVLGRIDFDEMGLDDPDVPAVTYALVQATAGGTLITAWLVAAVAGARRTWARVVGGIVLVVVAATWVLSLTEIYPRTGPGGASTSAAYWTVVLVTVTSTWLLLLAVALFLDRAPRTRALACAGLPAVHALLSAAATVALLVAVEGLGVTVVPVVTVVALALAAVSCALWAVPRERT